MKLSGRVIYKVACSDNEHLDTNDLGFQYFPSKAKAVAFAKKVKAKLINKGDSDYRYVEVVAYTLTDRKGEVDILFRLLNGLGFSAKSERVYKWENF